MGPNKLQEKDVFRAGMLLGIWRYQPNALKYDTDTYKHTRDLEIAEKGKAVKNAIVEHVLENPWSTHMKEFHIFYEKRIQGIRIQTCRNSEAPCKFMIVII